LRLIRPSLQKKKIFYL